MQANLDGSLHTASAVPQATALFRQLRQTWASEQHPVLHAEALLLQARLASLLAPADSALHLVQQALSLLQSQVSSPVEATFYHS